MRDYHDDIREALLPALTHLVQRDQMNATIHTSAVRWSPLTLRTARTVYSVGMTEAEAFEFELDGGGSHYLSGYHTAGEIWPALWEELGLAKDGVPLPEGWAFIPASDKARYD